MIVDKSKRRIGSGDRQHRTSNPDAANEFIGGPKIVVMGIGGGGNNALDNLFSRSDLEHVKMVVCNTDIQDLKNSICQHKIQLGPDVTQGLGAGGNPNQGALAARESMDEIMDSIDGAHMLFIACGMGGGTGTGASEEITIEAKEAGILVVCIVTQPFTFEGGQRMKVALEHTKKLQKSADILVVIPNNNILRTVNASTSMHDAFAAVDSVLADFVSSVTRIITRPGLVNIDFADVKSALYDMRARGMIGIGDAEGENRGLEAAERALSSPLLDDCSLRNARSVIVSVEGGKDMSILDVNSAVDRIQQEIVNPNNNDGVDCKFFFGASFDDTLSGKIRVTVLATLASTEDAAEINDAKPTNKQNAYDVFNNQTSNKQSDNIVNVATPGNKDHANDISYNNVIANDDLIIGIQHDSAIAAHEDRAPFRDDEEQWWNRFAESQAEAQKKVGAVKSVPHEELFRSSFTDGSEFMRRKK